MNEEDAGTVLDIYDLMNTNRIGPIKRRRDKWSKFRKGSDWRILSDGTVFEDDSGAIVGYCASDR